MPSEFLYRLIDPHGNPIRPGGSYNRGQNAYLTEKTARAAAARHNRYRAGYARIQYSAVDWVDFE